MIAVRCRRGSHIFLCNDESGVSEGEAHRDISSICSVRLSKYITSSPDSNPANSMCNKPKRQCMFAYKHNVYILTPKRIWIELHKGYTTSHALMWFNLIKHIRIVDCLLHIFVCIYNVSYRHTRIVGKVYKL